MQQKHCIDKEGVQKVGMDRVVISPANLLTPKSSPPANHYAFVELPEVLLACRYEREVKMA